MIRVLDSYALLAFFEKEKGWEKVEALFVAAVEKSIFLEITAVNFGEIYYIVLREYGSAKVGEIVDTISSLPIKIIDVDQELAVEAAKFKAAHKISYADCFAAALAKRNKSEVVTGDKEFKALEGQVKIAWLD